MPGLPGLPNDPVGTDNLGTADDTFRAILASLRAYGVHVISGSGASRPAAGELGRVYVATDQTPRVVSVDVGTGWIVDGSPPIVTALPLSPIDGQEILYLADATNGVVWRLKYRAASTSPYKWEFVGGAPLSATRDAAETTASTVPVGLNGPNLNLPLAGEYDLSVSGRLQNNTAGAASQMGVGLGSAAPPSEDSLFLLSSSVNAYASLSKSWRKTIATPTALQTQYTVTAGTGQFVHRTLQARPVRVG